VIVEVRRATSDAKLADLSAATFLAHSWNLDGRCVVALRGRRWLVERTRGAEGPYDAIVNPVINTVWVREVTA